MNGSEKKGHFGKMGFTLCHRKDLFKNLESLSRIISVKSLIIIAWTWIGLNRNKLIYHYYAADTAISNTFTLGNDISYYCY